jgi:hypothetical protein
MRRLLLGFVVLVTLLFSAAIVMIRAQPLAEGPLADFLNPPPGCPAPCFLGVRPNKTTIAQALAILRANPLVDDVRIEHHYAGQSIVWRWREGDDIYRRYAFRVQRNLVTRVVLPSNITLGELRLVLGEPESLTAAFTNEYLERAAFVLDYPQHGLHVFVGFYPCMVDQEAFWRIRHESTVSGSFIVNTGVPPYARILPATRMDLDPSTWAKQLRDFCRGRS